MRVLDPPPWTSSSSGLPSPCQLPLIQCHLTLEPASRAWPQFPELETGPSERAQVWEQLEQLAQSGNYLLGASSGRSPDGHGDTHTSSQGIVYGHAYGVLRVVKTSDGLCLLQLRNPWGDTEWTGKWGDTDMAKPENARVRAQIDFKKEDDGIFWIAFEDFVEQFTYISVCLLPQGMDLDGVLGGSWRGKSAGGCANNNTVQDNPQFAITISRPTEVVLTLTQDDARIGAGQRSDWQHSAIGMYVVHAPSGLKQVRSRFDIFRNEVASSDVFRQAREQTLRVSLDMRGTGSTTRYLIVPCTFSAGDARAFVLRAFTEKSAPSVKLERAMPTTVDEGAASSGGTSTYDV